MNREHRRIPIVIGAIITILCVGLLFLAAKLIEDRNRKPETRGDYRQRFAYDNVIEVDGKSYRQRKELTTVLLMGIDQDSDAEIVGYRSGGQADFLRLLVFDPTNKTISQLAIDRDTMTPITVLGFLGDQQKVRTLQICLSHGYGNGREQSCAFTVDAVSNLLLGTAITHYAAMNLDGISTLNDWAGGVTVTLEDDFSAVDPAMTEGTTLTLVGDQAETFVRSRMNVSDGTNAKRMQRQSAFLHSLAEKIGDRLKEDKEEISGLYDALTPYLVTDFSRGRLINEAFAARDYEMFDVVDIPGEHKIGDDGFMEYHVDEAGLQQLVLKLFYEEV